MAWITEQCVGQPTGIPYVKGVDFMVCLSQKYKVQKYKVAQMNSIAY